MTYLRVQSIEYLHNIFIYHNTLLTIQKLNSSINIANSLKYNFLNKFKVNFNKILYWDSTKKNIVN